VGTYWYALDYIERKDSAGTTFALGATVDTDVHGPYDEYVAKYGVDNADYLMEVVGGWQKHYRRAVYVDMGVGDGAQVDAQAQHEAKKHGWTFDRMAGDLVLIRRLLTGDWERDFLVLQPGQQIEMTCNDDVVGCLDGDHESD
jgi:hypothetical protein